MKASKSLKNVKNYKSLSFAPRKKKQFCVGVRVINGLLTIFLVFPEKEALKLLRTALRCASGCTLHFRASFSREDLENS